MLSLSLSPSRNKPLIVVQDEEISSTTPPEPADSTSDPAVADGTQTTAVDITDITQQAEASVKALLKYIDKGYKKRNYCLIKPGRWLEQVIFNGLCLL